MLHGTSDEGSKESVVKLGGNLHAELLLGLGLRGAGALTSFAMVWLIAQLFDLDVLGLFQLAAASLALLGVIGVMGHDTLLVREVAGHINSGRFAEAKAFFLGARNFVFWLASALALMLAIIAFPISEYALSEPRLTKYLMVLAPVALFLAALRLSNALLRSAGKVIASQSLEGVFYTSIVAIGLSIFWVNDWSVSENFLLLSYLMAVGLAAVVSYLLAMRLITSWPSGGSSQLQPRAGANIALSPIIALAGEWLILLSVTVLMDLAQTGIYRTIIQFAMLFQLVNTSFATMAGPHLSRAVSEGSANGIRKAISSAGLIGLTICLPFAALAFFAAEWLLGLFRPEFVSGAMALQVLILGQLISVGVGPIGIGLVMFRKERALLQIELVASAFGVVLAIALIGPFGLVGSASGVCLAIVLRKFMQFALLRRQLQGMASARTGVS